MTTKQRAILRTGLGSAQMTAALIAAYAAWQFGLTPVTWALVTLAGLLTATSLLIFRKDR